MSKFLAAALLGGALMMTGCQKDDPNMHDKDNMNMKASADDVCPHCPGVQHATADGRCEKCGAKVASSNGM